MDARDQPKIGRRALLAAGASGAAIAAVTALAGPARVNANDGDNVLVGHPNSGTGATLVDSSASDGLQGAAHTAAKSGVYGANSNAGGYGVFGRNTANSNIGSLGGPDDAVAGVSALGGHSGVFGATVNPAGYGVAGRNLASGLVGWLAGAGVAVDAEAPLNLTALKVVGKASFSRSGVLTVTAGHRTATKTGINNLTSSSIVLATIQQDRPLVFVEAAVPNPGGNSFTIYLNRTVLAATKVAWFIIG